MYQVLQGLPGIACYIDDILATGHTDEEHMMNLEALFKRLKNTTKNAEVPIFPRVSGELVIILSRNGQSLWKVH